MLTGIRENITPTIAAVATLLILFTTSLLLVLEWLRGRRALGRDLRWPWPRGNPRALVGATLATCAVSPRKPCHGHEDLTPRHAQRPQPAQDRRTDPQPLGCRQPPLLPARPAHRPETGRRGQPGTGRRRRRHRRSERRLGPLEIQNRQRAQHHLAQMV